MKKIIENKSLCKILVIALVLVPFIMIFAFWMQRSFKKQERIEYSIEKFSKVEDAVYFFGNQQKYILLNKQSDLHLGGGHYLFTTERKVMVKKKTELTLQMRKESQNQIIGNSAFMIIVLMT